MREAALAVLALSGLPVLPVAADVAGRVVVPDGRPVLQARVEAFAFESSVQRAERLVSGKARVPLGAATTAADGTFRLTIGLPTVDLRVMAEGFAPSFARVADGEATSLVLRKAPPARGLVTSQGHPVAGATVVWTTSDSSGGTQEVLVRTAADGTYGVPAPERWASGVTVLHPDYAPLQSGVGFPGLDPLRQELSAGVTIEGQAQDEASGRGVAQAVVVVDGWPAARTTLDGSFVVRHAPRDWSWVEVRDGRRRGRSGPRAGRIVVRTSPLGRLSGAVADLSTGRPVAGAIVSVYSESAESGVSETLSDGLGRYVLDLAPGRYYASVTHPRFVPSGAPGDEGAIDLRRPSARRDFEMTALVPVAGKVLDETGRPVGGALVRVVPRDFPRVYALDGLESFGFPSVWSAPDGTFALALPPPEPERAARSLVALKPGWAMGHIEGVSATAALANLVVTLPAGVALAGRVRDPEGRPAPDVAVVMAESGGFMGLLQAARANVAIEGWVRSGPDGRFETRVRPTAHELVFLSAGRSPRSVHRYDPSSDEPLEVALDAAVEIQGRALRPDGSAAAGLLVFAWGARLAEPVTARTASDGTFTLSTLEPGSYHLQLAREETPIGMPRIVEAPASDLQIELPPSGVIRGRVIDARSRVPLDRFEVGAAAAPGALDPGFPTRSAGPEEGDSGSFLLTDVPVGTVHMSVRAEGYVTALVESVRVADGEPVDVEVALDPGVTLAGTVRSDEGEPLADVAISLQHGAQTISARSGSNGSYEVVGVPPGPAEVSFRLAGFRTARESVEAADGGRLDVVLQRGLSVSGVVVADGRGVAKARVWASSSVAGADGAEAVTGTSGRFTVAGLSPGRYAFTARVPDGGEAEVRDVDVEKAGALRLEIRRPPRAVLTGHVVGLPASGDEEMVFVRVQGEGDSASAPVDGTGAFRVEKAPAGAVRAAAVAVSSGGAMRSSRVNELQLPPGSETEIVIEFVGDIVVSGTVTRDGTPAAGVTVTFQAGLYREARCSTDASGRYSAVGLEPGLYAVGVSGPDVSFATQYEVTGSAEFDIDATGAGITGTVADAMTGAPLAGAQVSLWFLDGNESRPDRSLETGGPGTFGARALRAGRYRLLATMDGYGQEVREIDLRRGTTAEAVVELTPAEGLAVAIFDQRDGRPLDAVVVVRDASRAIVANRHSGVGADGVLRIPLAPGRYLLSTSADGYGTATIPVSAPGSGVRVGLTPGGTLVIESARDVRGRVRLVQPDGEEYVRCWCNGIAGIDLAGRRTTVEHVAPGTYTIELVEAGGGSAERPQTVSIREGEVSTVTVE